MHISIWDEARTKQEILKRKKNATDSRSYLEDRWMRNERTIYSTTAGLQVSTNQASLESDYVSGMAGIDGSDADMAVAYVFKNFRFIHAQMSSNPPSVAMRPATSDADDHRRADAADRTIRWALRHYSMQEKIDQLSLNCLLYGSGIMKTVWDSGQGDIMSFDSETGELELEGDISVTNPFIWNIFLDPDAKSPEEIKFIFEEVYVDYDEACARWPDKKEELEKARVQASGQTGGSGSSDSKRSQLEDKHYNSVKLQEYWETGLPTNGYLGRFCVTTLDGDVIEKCRPSPFRFKQAGSVRKIEEDPNLPDAVKMARINKIPEQAFLPYHILTDIDVPNQVWGRSFIEYTSQLQDNLNRIDTGYIDSIQAHGVTRMVMPEGSDISETEVLTNSNWDVVKMTGSQPPYFITPPNTMPQIVETRANLVTGINDVAGVNESMFGQQSREQSGASMQYATNQGNMIRRRLFNKYVLVVESVYKSILNLIRKHWTTSRMISVVGKEKALEAVDLKGADIDGGYDVVGEYGTTLSLDPLTRRDEIMSMQPLFEKAGVPPNKLLRMMKLNELESAYDSLDRAGDRQKEIFDEMVAEMTYIKPLPYRDHTNMIAWALDYFMTSEYNILPREAQQLCEQHIQERGQLAAQETQPPAPAGAPGQPAAAPAPAEQPIPAPSPAEQGPAPISPG